MAVTLDNIADRVGVTKMTVSRALRGVGYTDKATRKRVLAAARDLGYQPNTAARAVASGRFGSVALVVGSKPSQSLLPPLVMNGLESVFAPKDVHITFTQIRQEQLGDESYVPKILRSRAVDGLLIAYNADLPDRFVRLIEESGQPKVWVNSKHPHDCVHPDDLRAGYQAAQRLLQLGHRRIGFIHIGQSTEPGRCPLREAPEHYSSKDRYEGYVKALKEAGLSPLPWIRRLPCTSAEAVGYVAERLSAPDRPTAMVCYGPTMSVQVYAAALSVGLRIPEDLSLITFRGGLAGQAPLPITAMRVPEKAIGQTAAEVILEKIADPTKNLKPQAVPFEFMDSDRESCAGPGSV